MKTANTQKQQTSQETKLAKKNEFGTQIAEVNLARKRGHSQRNNVPAPI